MRLINAARDNDKIDAHIYREQKAFVDNSMAPDYIPKFLTFMHGAIGKNKINVPQQPKL